MGVPGRGGREKVHSKGRGSTLTPGKQKKKKKPQGKKRVRGGG